MKCPVGTYGDAEGLSSITGCLKCPAGKYCDKRGKTLIDYTNNNCGSGFKCMEGSKSPYPSL